MTVPRIFISHSHLDNTFGSQLALDLRRELNDEQAVWYDVLGGLRGGQSWWEKIIEELLACDIFLLILSPDALDSVWVRREIDIALNENKYILPVLYRACNVRADLRTLQIISFLAPKTYEEAFQEVLFALGLPVKPPPVETREREALRLHPNDPAWLATQQEAQKQLSLPDTTSLSGDNPDQAKEVDSSSSSPKTGEQWLEEGRTLAGGKHDEEALAAFEQAIRLNPGYTVAYRYKGDILSRLERYEEAVAAYERAIELNSKDAQAHYEKGKNLQLLKLYEEALTAYEEAITLYPNYVYAYYGKGASLQELKRYEEALTAYEQAIQLNPNYAEAYDGKGIVLEQLGKVEEAQEARSKARQLGFKG